MSGLEQTFYIIAIVCMSLGLIMLAAVLTALFVIRAKVTKLEKMVQDKVHSAMGNVNKVVEIASAVREVAKSVKR